MQVPKLVVCYGQNFKKRTETRTCARKQELTKIITTTSLTCGLHYKVLMSSICCTVSFVICTFHAVAFCYVSRYYYEHFRLIRVYKCGAKIR